MKSHPENTRSASWHHIQAHDDKGLCGYPHKAHHKPTRPDGELDFDPDSPDLTDPQIDPPTPPRIPDTDSNPLEQRRAPGDQYPPYAEKSHEQH